MRDELIKRNVIIVTLALLVFFIASSILWNHFTKRNVESELVNISIIVNKQIADTTNETELRESVTKLTTNQSFLTISIANSNGNILIDSSNDAVGDSINMNLSTDELSRANSSDDNKHLYRMNDRMHYIAKLNDDIIVRTSFEIEDSNLGVLQSLFFVFVVAIGVIFLSLIFTRKTTERITDAFSSISNNLKQVNEGTYQEIDSHHRYKEVAEALEEINEVSNNIYNSLITIKNDSEKLQFLINNIDQGLLIINNKGKVLLINNYARNISNLPDDVINFDYHDLQYEKIVIDKITNTLETDESTFFDVVVDKLGKIYYVTINGFDNPWDDFTSAKRIYLIKFSEVTKERLEEKNKSEFIANASHELKTPITSISGFSELLLASKDNYNEHDVHFLEIIHNESVKMKEMIDQLLLLTNVENRFASFDLHEEVDLERIIEEEIEFQELVINKLELKVTKNIEVKKIINNELLIKQIIRNLLENAIKYNKQKGSIDISCLKDENNTKIIFKDTGIGIEERLLDKIFDRFYRADESHNSKKSGSGIGLNLVKQICNVLGAKITVESKIDVGSTFTIELNNY